MSNLRRGFLSLGLILGMFLGLVVSADASPGLGAGSTAEPNQDTTRNVFAGLCNIVVLDFTLTSNGVSGDTIDTMVVQNNGTADTDTVNNLYLYLDNGDNTFNSSSDSLAATATVTGDGPGTWTFSTFNTGTDILPDAVAQKYFLVLCVSSTLADPGDIGDTYQFTIPLGYLTTSKGDTNTSIVDDDNLDIQTITRYGELSFVQSDTITLITASTINNPVLTLIFSDTDEVTRIDTMPFTFSGTDNDTRNIVDLGLNKHIRIYRDDDGDTTFSLAGDTLISDTVTWDAANNRWIVELAGGGETIPITTVEGHEVWHVVVDVEDPDTATIGDTISLRVNIGSDTIYATGLQSTAVITATGSGTSESHWIVGRLDYSQTDAPPQALVTQCQTGVYMETLRCTSTYEAIIIDTITITDQGTNSSQNMDTIHLYLDNGDGIYNAADDQGTDYFGSMTYAPGAYLITTAGLQVNTGATIVLHVVYDIACGATVNDTVTAFIANDTDIVAEGLVSRTGSTTPPNLWLQPNDLTPAYTGSGQSLIQGYPHATIDIDTMSLATISEQQGEAVFRLTVSNDTLAATIQIDTITLSLDYWDTITSSYKGMMDAKAQDIFDNIYIVTSLDAIWDGFNGLSPTVTAPHDTRIITISNADLKNDGLSLCYVDYFSQGGQDTGSLVIDFNAVAASDSELRRIDGGETQTFFIVVVPKLTSAFAVPNNFGFDVTDTSNFEFHDVNNNNVVDSFTLPALPTANYYTEIESIPGGIACSPSDGSVRVDVTALAPAFTTAGDTQALFRVVVSNDTGSRAADIMLSSWKVGFTNEFLAPLDNTGLQDRFSHLMIYRDDGDNTFEFNNDTLLKDLNDTTELVGVPGVTGLVRFDLLATLTDVHDATPGDTLAHGAANLDGGALADITIPRAGTATYFVAATSNAAGVGDQFRAYFDPDDQGSNANTSTGIDCTPPIRRNLSLIDQNTNTRAGDNDPDEVYTVNFGPYSMTPTTTVTIQDPPRGIVVTVTDRTYNNETVSQCQDNVELFMVTVYHPGTAPDSAPVYLDKWYLDLTDGAGNPLTSGQANALFNDLKIWSSSDTVFNPTVDTMIASTTTFNIAYLNPPDTGQMVLFADTPTTLTTVNPGDTKTYFVTVSIDCAATPGATFGIELDPDGADTTTATDEETVLNDTNTHLAAIVRPVANEASFQIAIELEPEITVTALDITQDCVDNDGDWRNADDTDLDGSPSCNDGAVDANDNYGEQYVYTENCPDSGYSRPQPNYYLVKFLIAADSAAVINAEARIDKLGVEVYQSNDTGDQIDTSTPLPAANLDMALSFHDGIAYGEAVDWIEDDADGIANGIFDVATAAGTFVDTTTNDERTLWDNDTAAITVRLSVPCGTNDGHLMVKLILDPNPNSSSDGYVIDLNTGVDVTDTTCQLDVATTQPIVERMTDLLVSTSDAAADTFDNDGDGTNDEVDEEDVSKGQTDYTLLFNITDADTMQMNVDALINRLDITLTDVDGTDFTDSANVRVSFVAAGPYYDANDSVAAPGVFDLTTHPNLNSDTIDGGDTPGVTLSDSRPLYVRFDIPDGSNIDDGPMNVCLNAMIGNPNPEELNTNTDVDTGPFGALIVCNQILNLEEKPLLIITAHPTFEVSAGQDNVGGDTINYPLEFSVEDGDMANTNAAFILHKMGIVVWDNADTSDTPATGPDSGTIQISFFDDSSGTPTWSNWISTTHVIYNNDSGVIVVDLDAWVNAGGADSPTRNAQRTIEDNESETVYVRFNVRDDAASDTMAIKLTVAGDTYPLDQLASTWADTEVWPTDANSGNTVPSSSAQLTDLLYSPIVETPANIIVSSITAVDQVTGIANIIQIDGNDSTVTVTMVLQNTGEADGVITADSLSFWWDLNMNNARDAGDSDMQNVWGNPLTETWTGIANWFLPGTNNPLVLTGADNTYCTVTRTYDIQATQELLSHWEVLYGEVDYYDYNDSITSPGLTLIGSDTHEQWAILQRQAPVNQVRIYGPLYDYTDSSTWNTPSGSIAPGDSFTVVAYVNEIEGYVDANDLLANLQPIINNIAVAYQGTDTPTYVAVLVECDSPCTSPSQGLARYKVVWTGTASAALTNGQPIAVNLDYTDSGGNSLPDVYDAWGYATVDADTPTVVITNLYGNNGWETYIHQGDTVTIVAHVTDNVGVDTSSIFANISQLNGDTDMLPTTTNVVSDTDVWCTFTVVLTAAQPAVPSDSVSVTGCDNVAQCATGTHGFIVDDTDPVVAAITIYSDPGTPPIQILDINDTFEAGVAGWITPYDDNITCTATITEAGAGLLMYDTGPYQPDTALANYNPGDTTLVSAELSAITASNWTGSVLNVNMVPATALYYDTVTGVWTAIWTNIVADQDTTDGQSLGTLHNDTSTGFTGFLYVTVNVVDRLGNSGSSPYDDGEDGICRIDFIPPAPGACTADTPVCTSWILPSATQPIQATITDNVLMGLSPNDTFPGESGDTIILHYQVGPSGTWQQTALNNDTISQTAVFTATINDIAAASDSPTQTVSYWIEAYDRSGNLRNYGSQSAPFCQYNVDNTGPYLASFDFEDTCPGSYPFTDVLTVVISDTGAGLNCNDTSLQMVVTYPDGSQDTVSYDTNTASYTIEDTATSDVVMVTCPGNNYCTVTYTWAPYTLTGGTHTVAVTWSDTLGNTSTHTDSFMITTEPVVFSDSTPVGDTVCELRPPIGVAYEDTCTINADSTTLVMTIDFPVHPLLNTYVDSATAIDAISARSDTDELNITVTFADSSVETYTTGFNSTDTYGVWAVNDNACTFTPGVVGYFEHQGLWSGNYNVEIGINDLRSNRDTTTWTFGIEDTTPFFIASSITPDTDANPESCNLRDTIGITLGDTCTTQANILACTISRNPASCDGQPFNDPLVWPETDGVGTWNVTDSDSAVTQLVFTPTADFAYGTYNVWVEWRDLHHNSSSTTWSFAIEDTQPEWVSTTLQGQGGDSVTFPTQTTLSAAAAVGAEMISVTDADGFKVGDNINVDTDAGHAITVISGNNIYFSPVLSASHTAGTAVTNNTTTGYIRQEVTRMTIDLSDVCVGVDEEATIAGAPQWSACMGCSVPPVVTLTDVPAASSLITPVTVVGTWTTGTDQIIFTPTGLLDANNQPDSISALPAGTYNVTFCAVDNAGSSKSVSFDFHVDPYAPTLTHFTELSVCGTNLLDDAETSTVGTYRVGNEIALTVETPSDPDINYVVLEYAVGLGENATNAQIDAATWYPLDWDNSDSTEHILTIGPPFSATGIDIPDLIANNGNINDGALIYVRARAVDNAGGNVGAYSVPLRLYVDGTPPDVTLTLVGSDYADPYSPTTNTTLSAAATAGADTITVANASGFTVNDLATITDGANIEIHVVTAVNGNVLTLANALANNYDTNTFVDSDEDTVPDNNTYTLKATSGDQTLTEVTFYATFNAFAGGTANTHTDTQAPFQVNVTIPATANNYSPINTTPYAFYAAGEDDVCNTEPPTDTNTINLRAVDQTCPTAIITQVSNTDVTSMPQAHIPAVDGVLVYVSTEDNDGLSTTTDVLRVTLEYAPVIAGDTNPSNWTVIDSFACTEDYTDPIVFAWDTHQLNSDYVLRARITDWEGNECVSTKVTIKVEGTCLTMPWIITPADNSETRDMVTVSAITYETGVYKVKFEYMDASDTSDTWHPIAEVVGNNNPGSPANQEWTTLWDTTGLEDGPFFVQATSTDIYINECIGDSITVTIDNTISCAGASISAPAQIDGDNYIPGPDNRRVVTLTATLADTHDIAGVDFNYDVLEGSEKTTNDTRALEGGGVGITSDSTTWTTKFHGTSSDSLSLDYYANIVFRAVLRDDVGNTCAVTAESLLLENVDPTSCIVEVTDQDGQEVSDGECFTGTLNFLLTATDNKNVDCVSLAYLKLDQFSLTEAITGGDTIAVSDASLLSVDDMICVYGDGDSETVKVTAINDTVLTVRPALGSYSAGAGAGIWQIDGQDCTVPYQLSLNVSGFDEGLYVFTSMPKDIAGNVNYPRWTGDDCALELDIEHVEEITIAGVNDASDSSLYKDIPKDWDWTSAPRTTADNLIVTGTLTPDNYVYADSVAVNIWYIKQIECGDTWDSVDNDGDGQFGEDRTVNGIDEDCCGHDTTHDDGEDSINSRDNWVLAGQATVTDDVAGDGRLNYTYNWDISALHGVYKFKAEAALNNTVYASTEEPSSVWCDGYTKSHIIEIDHECPVFTDQDQDGDAFTNMAAGDILNAEQNNPYTIQVDPKDSGAFCNYSLDGRSDSGVDRVCFSYDEGSGWVSIDGTDNDSDGSFTEDPADGINNDTDYIGQDNEVIRDMDGDGCFDRGLDIVLYEGDTSDTQTAEGFIMTAQIDEDGIDCDKSGPNWTAQLDVTKLTPSNRLAVTLRAGATDVDDNYSNDGTTCDTTMIIYVDNIAPEARLLSADSSTVSPENITTENIVQVIEWSQEGILLVAEVDFNPVDSPSWQATQVGEVDEDGNTYDVANVSFFAWQKDPITGDYIGTAFLIGDGDDVDNNNDGVANAYTVRWQGFGPGTYDVYTKASDVNGNNETDTSEKVTVVIHDLSGPQITLGGVGLPEDDFWFDLPGKNSLCDPSFIADEKFGNAIFPGGVVEFEGSDCNKTKARGDDLDLYVTADPADNIDPASVSIELDGTSYPMGFYSINDNDTTNDTIPYILKLYESYYIDGSYAPGVPKFEDVRVTIGGDSYPMTMSVNAHHNEVVWTATVLLQAGDTYSQSFEIDRVGDDDSSFMTDPLIPWIRGNIIVPAELYYGNVDISTMGDGPYTIRAHAADILGREVTVSKLLIIDNTPPEMTNENMQLLVADVINDCVEGSHIRVEDRVRSGEPFTLTAVITDPQGLDPSDPANINRVGIAGVAFQVSREGNDTAGKNQWVTIGSEYFDWDWDGSDGWQTQVDLADLDLDFTNQNMSFMFRAVPFDDAMNFLHSADGKQIMIDGTEPKAEITSMTVNDSPVMMIQKGDVVDLAAEVVLNQDDELDIYGVKFQYSLGESDTNGEVWYDIPANGAIPSSDDCPNNTVFADTEGYYRVTWFTAESHLPDAADAYIQIRAVAEDLVGNEDSAPTPDVLVLDDNTAPNAYITWITNCIDRNILDPYLAVTDVVSVYGLADLDTAKVNVYYRAASDTVWTRINTTHLDTVSVDNFVVEWDTLNLAEGTYYLVAEPLDADGNGFGADLNTLNKVEVLVDHTPPVVVSFVAPTVIANTSDTIIFEVNADATSPIGQYGAVQAEMVTLQVWDEDNDEWINLDTLEFTYLDTGDAPTDTGLWRLTTDGEALITAMGNQTGECNYYLRALVQDYACNTNGLDQIDPDSLPISIVKVQLDADAPSIEGVYAGNYSYEGGENPVIRACGGDKVDLYVKVIELCSGLDTTRSRFQYHPSDYSDICDTGYGNKEIDVEPELVSTNGQESLYHIVWITPPNQETGDDIYPIWFTAVDNAGNSITSSEYARVLVETDCTAPSGNVTMTVNDCDLSHICNDSSIDGIVSLSATAIMNFAVGDYYDSSPDINGDTLPGFDVSLIDQEDTAFFYYSIDGGASWTLIDTATATYDCSGSNYIWTGVTWDSAEAPDQVVLFKVETTIADWANNSTDLSATTQATVNNPRADAPVVTEVMKEANKYSVTNPIERGDTVVVYAEPDDITDVDKVTYYYSRYLDDDPDSWTKLVDPSFTVDYTGNNEKFAMQWNTSQIPLSEFMSDSCNCVAGPVTFYIVGVAQDYDCDADNTACTWPIATDIFSRIIADSRYVAVAIDDNNAPKATITEISWSNDCGATGTLTIPQEEEDMIASGYITLKAFIEGSDDLARVRFMYREVGGQYQLIEQEPHPAVGCDTYADQQIWVLSAWDSKAHYLDGEYEFGIFAVDAFGNKLETTFDFKLRIDNVHPTNAMLTVSGPNSRTTVGYDDGSQAPLAANATLERGDVLLLLADVDGAEDNDVTQAEFYFDTHANIPHTWTHVATDYNVPYSYSWNTGAIARNLKVGTQYDIRVVARDRVGCASEAIVTMTVEDNTAQAVISRIVTGCNVYGDTLGDCEDVMNARINGEADLYAQVDDDIIRVIFKYRKQGSQTWITADDEGRTSPTVGIPWTVLFNWDTTALDEGVYELATWATDDLGNNDAQPQIVTVIVDRRVDVKVSEDNLKDNQVVGFADNADGSTNSDATIDLIAKLDVIPNAKLLVSKLSDELQQNVDGRYTNVQFGFKLCSDLDADTSSWNWMDTTAYNTIPAYDAQTYKFSLGMTEKMFTDAGGDTNNCCYDFAIKIVDKACNDSYTVIARSVSVDNLDPLACITSIKGDMTLDQLVDVSNDTSVEIRMTATDLCSYVTKIQFQIDTNAHFVTPRDIDVLTAPDLNPDSDGYYTITWNTTGMPAGTYYLRVVATDAVGNMSNGDGCIRTVKVRDTLPPVAAICGYDDFQIDIHHENIPNIYVDAIYAVAYCPDVKEVQFQSSKNGGQTWTNIGYQGSGATQIIPSLPGRDQYSLWKVTWVPEPGTYQIRAIAKDTSGNVDPSLAPITTVTIASNGRATVTDVADVQLGDIILKANLIDDETIQITAEITGDEAPLRTVLVVAEDAANNVTEEIIQLYPKPGDPYQNVYVGTTLDLSTIIFGGEVTIFTCGTDNFGKTGATSEHKYSKLVIYPVTRALGTNGTVESGDGKDNDGDSYIDEHGEANNIEVTIVGNYKGSNDRGGLLMLPTITPITDADQLRYIKPLAQAYDLQLLNIDPTFTRGYEPQIRFNYDLAALETKLGRSIDTQTELSVRYWDRNTEEWTDTGLFNINIGETTITFNARTSEAFNNIYTIVYKRTSIIHGVVFGQFREEKTPDEFWSNEHVYVNDPEQIHYVTVEGEGGDWFDAIQVILAESNTVDLNSIELTIDGLPAANRVHLNNITDLYPLNDFTYGVVAYDLDKDVWGYPDVGQLKDGRHTLEVYVRDNFGKEYTETYTFYMDNTPPEMEIVGGVLENGTTYFDPRTSTLDVVFVDQGVGIDFQTLLEESTNYDLYMDIYKIIQPGANDQGNVVNHQRKVLLVTTSITGWTKQYSDDYSNDGDHTNDHWYNYDQQTTLTNHQAYRLSYKFNEGMMRDGDTFQVVLYGDKDTDVVIDDYNEWYLDRLTYLFENPEEGLTYLLSGGSDSCCLVVAMHTEQYELLAANYPDQDNWTPNDPFWDYYYFTDEDLVLQDILENEDWCHNPAVRNFVIDMTAPAISSNLAEIAEVIYSNGEAINITATASDQGAGLATTNGLVIEVCGANGCSSVTDGSFTIINPSGRYVVTITATDKVGRTTVERKTFVVVDESVVLSVNDAHNYPNPFDGSTCITYQMNKPARVTIKIYDLAGDLIKTICEGQTRVPADHSTFAQGQTRSIAANSGYDEVTWSGDDDGGSRVANGVYLCYIKVTDGSKTYTKVIKVAVLR